MAKKKTYAQLERDLAANQALLADVMRQRNDALGVVAQANQKVVTLEAKLSAANQTNAFLRRQVGDVLEMCGSLLRA
jgi:hypothetical protein